MPSASGDEVLRFAQDDMTLRSNGMTSSAQPIHIVGGGLAGSEAAWQIASAGVPVVLHEEMRRAGSLIMRAADAHKLPAGGALAVDRHGFSAAVQQALLAHPLLELRREEIAGALPDDWDNVIVATG